MDAFRKISYQVSEETEKRQVPWFEGIIHGRFEFSPVITAQPIPTAVLPAPLPKPITPAALDKCQRYLDVKPLTGKTVDKAFDCYQELLQQVPNDYEVLTGLRIIADKYLDMENDSLQRKRKKAARNFRAKAEKIEQLLATRSIIQHDDPCLQTPNKCNEQPSSNPGNAANVTVNVISNTPQQLAQLVTSSNDINNIPAGKWLDAWVQLAIAVLGAISGLGGIFWRFWWLRLKRDFPAARLIDLSTKEGRVYRLKSRSTQIGRKGWQENAIAIDSDSISRRHARIDYRIDTKAFYLVDMGSTHGTELNHQAVPKNESKGVLIKHRDEIMLAEFKFLFLLDSEMFAERNATQRGSAIETAVTPRGAPIDPNATV